MAAKTKAALLLAAAAANFSKFDERDDGELYWLYILRRLPNMCEMSPKIRRSRRRANGEHSVLRSGELHRQTLVQTGGSILPKILPFFGPYEEVS